MGLTDFKRFQELRKQGHDTKRMGFHVKTGAVNIYANRVRLARSFRGIHLDEYHADTVAGYEGFFQVALTYSAWECFMSVHGLINNDARQTPQWSELTDRMAAYDPRIVVDVFNGRDADSKLYNFLDAHIDNKTLKCGFASCRDGSVLNIYCIAAAIRHIFMHGYLTASANGIKPQSIKIICQTTSDFLLKFMDGEFTQVIDAYCERIRAVQTR